MKAILVIDVDDVSRYHADVYKDDDKGNGDLIMNYCPLKPMPEPKEHNDEVDYDYGFIDGWNECLEEIEK